jgi:hypothetical protein
MEPVRSCGQKLIDFWDDLGIWNPFGLTFVAGISIFVLCLEVLHGLYGT